MHVLVTGSSGFVGRNLCAELGRREGVHLYRYDLDSDAADLERGLGSAELVFHLAGVNRPRDPGEYHTGNAGFTEHICRRLAEMVRHPRLILSSSIQAELDNPYGLSKRQAEQAVEHYARQTGATAVAFRLKNLFGKWCRPNYNSVTATFCHNIAHDLPIQISNPANVVDLTYIDDVVAALVRELDAPDRPGTFTIADPLPSRRITLGELAERVRSFHDHRRTLRLADYSDPFVRSLYATYLSYLEPDNFAYMLDIKRDNRGSLAEFIKSPAFGQIFISHTHPGITRGNHFHHTKTEKFLVVHGQAMIRLRQIEGDKVIEFRISGDEYRVVDIPPGYTHSIENVGRDELVTLFWASEAFDPHRPDTAFVPVIQNRSDGV